MVRTSSCSYFIVILQPRTSYRYGLPVPASSLRRDERSLFQQDGLLSCIPLGGLRSGIPQEWFQSLSYSHVHQHMLRLLRGSVIPKLRVLELLRQNTWRVRMNISRSL